MSRLVDHQCDFDAALPRAVLADPAHHTAVFRDGPAEYVAFARDLPDAEDFADSAEEALALINDTVDTTASIRKEAVHV